MEQTIITGAIGGFSCFIAFLCYEHTKQKDSQSLVTSIAILMTKVDSLTSIKEKVDKHEEMLIRHSEKIHNLEDTIRFKKLNKEELENYEKDKINF